jgi:predicted small lipoprotein YifL
MDDKRTMFSRPEIPVTDEELKRQPEKRVTRRALLLVAALALPLAACGRKGPPELPEDADPKAPRRYPTRGY